MGSARVDLMCLRCEIDICKPGVELRVKQDVGRLHLHAYVCTHVCTYVYACVCVYVCLGCRSGSRAMVGIDHKWVSITKTPALRPLH